MGNTFYTAVIIAIMLFSALTAIFTLAAAKAMMEASGPAMMKLCVFVIRCSWIWGMLYALVFILSWLPEISFTAPNYGACAEVFDCKSIYMFAKVIDVRWNAFFAATLMVATGIITHLMAAKINRTAYNSLSK